MSVVTAGSPMVRTTIKFRLHEERRPATVKSPSVWTVGQWLLYPLHGKLL